MKLFVFKHSVSGIAVLAFIQTVYCAPADHPAVKILPITEGTFQVVVKHLEENEFFYPYNDGGSNNWKWFKTKLNQRTPVGWEHWRSLSAAEIGAAAHAAIEPADDLTTVRVSVPSGYNMVPHLRARAVDATLEPNGTYNMDRPYKMTFSWTPDLTRSVSPVTDIPRYEDLPENQGPKVVPKRSGTGRNLRRRRISDQFELDILW